MNTLECKNKHCHFGQKVISVLTKVKLTVYNKKDEKEPQNLHQKGLSKHSSLIGQLSISLQLLLGPHLGFGDGHAVTTMENPFLN